MKRTIALVGLSGTGKSTVGRLLVDQLDQPLYDTDMLIIEAAGRPIPAIFASDGEAGFREYETAALRQALERGPAIIATGGGIVLRPENRALLREHAFVIWLDAPVSTLVTRLQAHDEERPLLAGDALARLAALREARAAFYTEVAHLHISTESYTAAQVRELILQALQHTRG